MTDADRQYNGHMIETLCRIGSEIAEAYRSKVSGQETSDLTGLPCAAPAACPESKGETL